MLLPFLAAASVNAGEPGDGSPLLDPSRAADIRDDTPEAEREWPTAAVAYLLHEVAERPEVAAYSRSRERLTAATDRSPARFEFVWFRGRLEELTEGPDHLQEGRVVLAEGEGAREAVFVTPVPPREAVDDKAVPSDKPITDGLVQVRGIFVKRYRPGADGAAAFLVVATQVERAYEAKPVRSLDDVGFDAVRDDQELMDGRDAKLDASRFYVLPLMRLVKYADAGAPAATAPEDLGDVELLLRHPAKARGRLVTGTGALADEPLHYRPGECAPNDAGVEGYVTGWIVSDRQKLLQFAAPERLAGVGKARQHVRFTGFFYKWRTHLARDGSTRLAPLFVLTDLKPVGP